jgi:hypothetical protein
MNVTRSFSSIGIRTGSTQRLHATTTSPRNMPAANTWLPSA